MGVLENFTFGFDTGDEVFSAETDFNNEFIEIHFSNPRQDLCIVNKNREGKFFMTLSDVTRPNAPHEDDRFQVIKSTWFHDFDPLAFKAIAYEWVGVPAEVTT